jgi:hypothetical protein
VIRQIAFLVLALSPVAAKAEGVLPQAIEGYKATCLATAPSFVGLSKAAKHAGFIRKNGSLSLPDSSVRVELVTENGNCACHASLVAPDPNGTAAAVLSASLNTRPVKAHTSAHKEIAAILEWPNGTNALQVEADTRVQIPMVHAYLISQSACPKE